MTDQTPALQRPATRAARLSAIEQALLTRLVEMVEILLQAIQSRGIALIEQQLELRRGAEPVQRIELLGERLALVAALYFQGLAAFLELGDFLVELVLFALEPGQALVRLGQSSLHLAQLALGLVAGVARAFQASLRLLDVLSQCLELAADLLGRILRPGNGRG